MGMYGDSSGTSGTEAKSEHAKVTYFHFTYNNFYAKLFLSQVVILFFVAAT